jgi:hypothetical protein
MTLFIPINMITFPPSRPFIIQLGHMIPCSPAKIPLNARKYFKNRLLLTAFLEDLPSDKESLHGIYPKRICRIRKTDATDLPGMVDDFSKGVSI